jgi:GTP cyclohydrolase I
METPRRVAKAYVNDLWKGRYTPFTEITSFPSDGYDGVIIERNINLTSMCSHHHQTIRGVVHIGYIAGAEGRVIGLSKLNRIVQYFAKRPQVQERLTMQIAKYLQKVLETDHVAVFIDAKHLCVSSRGVKDDATSTITSFYGGKFQEENTKREFLDSLHN